MNQVYRVVFNRSLGVWQCVSEIAKAGGKTKSVKLLSLAVAVTLSGQAFANETLIDDGQLHEFNPNAGVDGFATVANPNTVVSASNELQVGMTVDTQLAIRDSAIVKSNDALIGYDSTGSVQASNLAQINANNLLSVGAYYDGNLSITNGASSTSNILSIADPTTTASVTVDGKNLANNKASQIDTQTLLVGNYGKGTLTASNGAIINSNGATVGNKPGSQGIANITSKATWNDNKQLAIGGDSTANGVLNIDNGTVNSALTVVGNQANTTGTINITNNGLLNVSQNTFIGESGNGTVNINSGGKIIRTATTPLTPQLIIGNAQGSNGTLNIADENSAVAFDNGQVFVGNYGTGSLNIKNKATASAEDIAIANSQGSKGTVTVDGLGSTLNIADMTWVGTNDAGNMNVTNGGKVNTQFLSLSDKPTGQGNLTIDGANSVVKVDDTALLGRQGTANVNITNNGALQAPTIHIGEEANSQNNVVNINKDGRLIGDEIIVGNNGTATVNLLTNAIINAKNTLTLGKNANSKGVINLDGQNIPDTFGGDIFADTLIIGDAGEGEVHIKGMTDPSDNSVHIIGNQSSTIIGNQKGSKGILDIQEVAYQVEGNIVVGNEGSGTLYAHNGALIEANNIIRNDNATLSDVNFDNASIQITKSEPNYFAGFNASTPIKLNNSFVFDVYHENMNDTTPLNVTINPNAVMTGNVGNLPENYENQTEQPPHGFIKLGDGTLEMSANTMQWTGDTIVSEGILKVNGDYTMKSGDRLGVALFDHNNNGTLADDSYGKFVFTNKADISQGGFYVFADKAIETTPNTSVWKDVVTAGTLVGKFKQVEDNSPLVDFYADYSDPNKVHLQMTAPTTPPVTPPITPPVVIPPVTPPVTEPPVTPPVVTPPVTEPSVTPPVVTPPVTEPPVTPPVVTPPVVTPSKSTTFVRAVTQQHNLSTLDLAGVLDSSIDSKIATGTNALADTLIKNTLNYNQAQLSQGTSELQPLFIGSVNRMVVDSNNLATNAIIEQSTKRERNVWAKAVGTQATKDHDGKIMGYKAKDAGIIAGADTAVTDKLNLGMAVSYLHTDADSDGHPIDHEMTAKNWQVLGYGDYQATDATRANFHVGAGQSDVKGERHIKTFGQTTAKSDYNVDTLQAGMGVSHRIGTEQKNIAPFAQVNYVQAKSDSYHETGAGAFNLDVKKHTYNSLRSTLGINIRQPLTQQVALTGTLAGALENGDPCTDITASFAGTPNATFVTKGREVGKEVGIAGVGLSYKPSALTEASINYMGEWRKDYDSQGVSLIFSKKF